MIRPSQLHCHIVCRRRTALCQPEVYIQCTTTTNEHYMYVRHVKNTCSYVFLPEDVALLWLVCHVANRIVPPSPLAVPALSRTRCRLPMLLRTDCRHLPATIRCSMGESGPHCRVHLRLVLRPVSLNSRRLIYLRHRKL